MNLVPFFRHEVLQSSNRNPDSSKSKRTAHTVEKSFCHTLLAKAFEPPTVRHFCSASKTISKEGGGYKEGNFYVCLFDGNKAGLAGMPILPSPFMTPIHHLWQQLFLRVTLILAHNWTFAPAGLESASDNDRNTLKNHNCFLVVFCRKQLNF